MNTRYSIPSKFVRIICAFTMALMLIPANAFAAMSDQAEGATNSTQSEPSTSASVIAQSESTDAAQAGSASADATASNQPDAQAAQQPVADSNQSTQAVDQSASSTAAASSSSSTEQSTSQKTTATEIPLNGSTSVITPQADGDMAFEFLVKNANGGVLNYSNVNLGDNLKVIPEVVFTPKAGTATASTITINVPDYYSFDDAYKVGTYDNYSIVSISDITTTNTNAKRNQIVISVPAPADPSKPTALDASFSANLNKTSIDDTRANAERNGTWTPNGTVAIPATTKFSASTNNFTGATVDKDVTYTLKNYTGIQPYFNYVNDARTDLSLVDYYDGNPSLNEHGKGEYWGYRNNPVWITYVLPDPYSYGASVAKNVVLTAPEGFTWVDFTAKTATYGGTAAKNLSSTTQVAFSADKKTATVTWTDDLTDTSLKRSLGCIHLMPDTVYWSQKNQDASTVLPANTSYTIPSVVTLGDDTTYNPSDIHMHIVNYASMKNESTDANGIWDDNGKLILQKVTAGSTHTVGDVTLFPWSMAGTTNTYRWNNAGTEYYVPSTDGSPTTCTMTLDSRILATDVNITGNYAADSSFVADDTVCPSPTMTTRKVSSLTYYTTAHPEGITADLSSTNVADTFSLSTYMTSALAAGEYLTKVSVTYSKFAYSTQAFSSMRYSVASTAKNGDLYLITYDSDATPTGAAEQKASSSNYILVDNSLCPTFNLSSGGNSNTSNQTTLYTNGRYGDGSDGGEGITLKVTNDFLGDIKDSEGTVQKSTGVITKLTNPVFSFIPTSDDVYYTSYITNGKLHMHAVMGGGWTAKVTTISAAELKAGGSTMAASCPHTYTVEEPAGVTGDYTWDLHATGNIKPDQVITGVVLSKQGDLDISSLSNTWDGTSSGKAVDKVLVSLGIDNLETMPLTGLYPCEASTFNGTTGCAKFYQWGDYSGGLYVPEKNFCNVKYDNCADVDTRHEGTIGYTVDRSGYPAQKGADCLIPSSIGTTWAGQLIQGTVSTLEADVALSALCSGEPKLLSQPGETFYLKLSTQQYVSFAGNAKIDGVSDPDAAVVTIGEAKYLKITNRATDSTEKTVTSGTGQNWSYATFQPWKVTFDVYSQPQTPTTAPLQIVNGSGSWLDLTNAGDSYTYTVDGTTYRTAIQSDATDQHVGNKNTWAQTVGNNGNCKDDPLGLYAESEATDLHWALPFSGWSITPNANAVSGVVMLPGIDGSYQPNKQAVKSYQEGSLNDEILFMPGTSFDMDNLTTTIKIPRAGDTTTVSGTTYTTNVNLYLTGPLTTIKGTISGTTDPVVTYSTDGGNTFVSADEIAAADWSKVTHAKIDVTKVAKNDAVSLAMPLRTETYGDGTAPIGSEGAAYMVSHCAYDVNGTGTSTDCLNTFTFGPDKVSGTVWIDANQDGMMDSTEAKVSGATVKLYENYAAGATPVAMTATAIDGTYSFSTENYKNLTVEVAVPTGMESTTYTGSTDNKFAAGKKDVTTSLRGVPTTLTGDIEKIDAGVFDPRSVTYDGNGATSGSVPAATTDYAVHTTVTVLGNSGASVDPAVPLARTGYTFAGWNTQANGKGTGYVAGDTFTITANTTLYAKWVENTADFTYTSGNTDQGTVSKGTETVGVVTGVPAGSTASPKAGYHFVNWTNNLDSTTTADAALSKGQIDAVAKKTGIYVPVTFTAHFAEDSVEIDYASEDAAKGTVAPASETLGAATGTAAGSTATPKTGYHFVNWTNNLDSTTSTDATLSQAQVDAVAKKTGVYKAATFTAHFAEDSVEIDYASEDAAKGTVAPASETVGVFTGSPKGSTATAATGYHFVNWTNNVDSTTTTDATLSKTQVDAVSKVGGSYTAVAFTAHFAEDSVEIDYASEDAAKGTVAPASETLTAVSGAAAGSTASAVAGYHFVNWTNNLDSTTSTDATLSQAQVDAVAKKTGVYKAATFTAHFAEDVHVTIAYASADSKTGTVDPGSNDLNPTTGTATGSTATPKPGYHFVNWTNNLDSTATTDATLSQAQVDAVAKGSGSYVAATFTAHFAEDEAITLTYVSENVNKGTVDPGSEGVLPATGSAKGSTATAMPGHHFVNWTYDTGLQPNSDGVQPQATAQPQATEVAGTDATLTPAQVDAVAKVSGAYVATTFTAHFAEDDVTINYVTADATMGAVDPAAETLAAATGVATGSKAAPNEGCTFVSWTDAQGKVVSTDPSFAPAKVNGLNVAATYTANFVAKGKVSMVKTVDNESAAPGENLTYVLTLTNTGSTTSDHIWVKDIVPANTRFVSCDALGTYHATNDGTEYVTWYVDPIEPGKSVALTLTVKVAECQDGTSLANTAYSKPASTEPDPATDPTQGGTATTNTVQTTVSNPTATTTSTTASTQSASTAQTAKTDDPVPLAPIALTALAAAGVLLVARRRRDLD